MGRLPLQSIVIDCNKQGDNIIIPGLALPVRHVIRVYRYFFRVGTALSLTMADGLGDSGPDLTGPMPLAAGDDVVGPYDGEPWFECSPGNPFVFYLASPAQVSGRIYFTRTPSGPIA
jgi:hypothetical protein